MIRASGIFKKFGKTSALRDISLQVNEGTIHGLIGPNGAGKSTTIKILSTLVRPDLGEVSIGGLPLKKGTAIRRLIGVVPETPRLHEHLTARQEITAYAKLSGIPQVSQRVNTVIKKMDLEIAENQEISRYSTGMKKRVALAIALVTDPPVLLLDEPMSGLDPVVRRKFKDVILGLEGKTILISDHDLYTVDELCTSVTILKEGRTLIEDSIDSLRMKVGRASVEIRPVDPDNLATLAAELGQMPQVNSIDVDKDIIIASVGDPQADIPQVIRRASSLTDILEARQSRISLEEIFIKFAAGGNEK